MLTLNELIEQVIDSGLAVDLITQIADDVVDQLELLGSETDAIQLLQRIVAQDCACGDQSLAVLTLECLLGVESLSQYVEQFLAEAK